MRAMLMIGALVASLLLGVSGEAQAVPCLGGSIVNETVDSVEIGAGDSCLLVAVTVLNSITADGAASVVVVENDVGGGIFVTGSAFVGIVNNRVFDGSIVVEGNALVQVLDNSVLTNDIRVNGNGEADVNRNAADDDILCEDNGRLDSFLNRARGEDDCRD